MKNIIVYDNFYENPDSIRNIALDAYKKEINENNLYDSWHFLDFINKFDDIPGIKKNKNIYNISYETNSFYTSIHEKKIEELLNSKIQYTCEKNGIFILDNCLKNTSININNNIINNNFEEWIGIVFLTPNAPYEGGITIKQNKKLKKNSLESIKNLDESVQKILLNELNNCSKDNTFWETDTVIANLYNRIILLKKDYFYCSSLNFGIRLNESKLIHYFSFGILKNNE